MQALEEAQLLALQKPVLTQMAMTPIQDELLLQLQWLGYWQIGPLERRVAELNLKARLQSKKANFLPLRRQNKAEGGLELVGQNLTKLGLAQLTFG